MKNSLLFSVNNPTYFSKTVIAVHHLKSLNICKFLCNYIIIIRGATENFIFTGYGETKEVYL